MELDVKSKKYNDADVLEVDEDALIKLIEEHGMTPEQVITMLVGKYVRIMKAPTSTILTEEQIKQMAEGTFIEGEFLGMDSPICIPFKNNYPLGNSYPCFIGKVSGGSIEFVISRALLKTDGEIYIISNPLTISSYDCDIVMRYAKEDNVSSGDTITLNGNLDKALKAHKEVEINGHRCRFESEQERGGSTYIVYSSFGEVSATGKLTANIISYNKSTREISFNQMTFTPDA